MNSWRFALACSSRGLHGECRVRNEPRVPVGITSVRLICGFHNLPRLVLGAVSAESARPPCFQTPLAWWRGAHLFVSTQR
jgi:hypothetical protein